MTGFAENSQGPRRDLPDRMLWRRSLTTDAAEDEVARFLDLAGYAEDRLDPDERERVAALLALDIDAASDVAAARLLAGMAANAAGEPVIARACALVGLAGEGRRVVAFRPATRARRIASLHGAARWGSLAAALALASWLGFAMGSDASVALRGPDQASPDQAGDDNFLTEILDPSTGFLRELTDGQRT
ncbi:MAG: hypothetical protein JO267_09320 [Alphaproteobacteria bacterium]|nr:hypothetical protein [Alphaproteobacteria bacterium]